MKRGKLIVIEGTDGSGKQTQSELLYHRLNSEQIKTELGTFPRYDQPFGKLVGGPFLGKPDICPSYFSDPATVDPKAASMLYCAERRHELPWIENPLKKGIHRILDRYVDSNRGMQGGKIRDRKERENFFGWLETLEYEMAELPRPDLTAFLYVPYNVGMELQSKNNKAKDAVEENKEYLRNAEESYLHLAEIASWHVINCAPEGTIDSLRGIKDIHEELYSIVKKII